MLMMNRYRLFLMRWAGCLLGLLLVFSICLAADAAPRQDPFAELNRDQRRIFQNYTRLFCRQFFRLDEKRFVILPNHSPRRENSSGRTYDETEAVMTETRLVRKFGQTVEEKIKPPAGEVIARAMVIPDIDVGHYGHINSVTVEKVIGPDEMIVRNVVLIPSNQVGSGKNQYRKALVNRQKKFKGKRYRLLGFKTEGLQQGQAYVGPRNKGLHIAVLSTDPEHSFVLVNYERLQRTRTHEFPEVLSYVHIEPLMFLDMVRSNREKAETTSKGDIASLISIYKRFYNRYKPKKLSGGPAVKPPTQPEPEPKPDPKPDPKPKDNLAPKPEPKPEPKPRPKPEPVEEEDDDDWEYEEEDTGSDEPSFFGIPF